MNFQLYADGSRTTNSPKQLEHNLPGAWACLITDEHKEWENVLSGAELTHSNDRMELLSVVNGLQFITQFSPDKQNVARIFSDSRYVFYKLMQTMPESKIQEFRSTSFLPPSLKRHTFSPRYSANDFDLTSVMGPLLEQTDVAFTKVEKANAPLEHARCDQIARMAREELAKKIGLVTMLQKNITIDPKIPRSRVRG